MVENTEHAPGAGPASGISVSLTAGTLAAIRERVGKRGVSAWLEEAAQRQIERENLDAYLADYVSEHGEFTPEEIAAAEAELFPSEAAPGAAA